MSTINVQQLLQPISDSAPCGPNLEFDPEFLKLEEAAAGKPEQEMGSVFVPAQPPDWKAVRSIAQELLKKTRDLRVLVFAARAGLVTSGLAVFCDWLEVLQGTLASFWESVHPQLDADDDLDPEFRVNTLSGLCDADATLRLFLDVELVSATGVGKITWGDVLVSKGERQPPAEGTAMEQSLLDAIFMACDVEHLKSQAKAVSQSLEAVKSIDKDLTDKVGSDRACNFDPLVKQFVDLGKYLEGGLTLRGVAGEGGAASGESSAPVPGGAVAAAPPPAPTGDLQSRADVVKAIERIIKYYNVHEPSSPIPVLLEGAKRMASMDFLEIMGVLTADGLKHLKSLAGKAEK